MIWYIHKLYSWRYPVRAISCCCFKLYFSHILRIHYNYVSRLVIDDQGTRSHVFLCSGSDTQPAPTVINKFVGLILFSSRDLASIIFTIYLTLVLVFGLTFFKSEHAHTLTLYLLHKRYSLILVSTVTVSEDPNLFLFVILVPKERVSIGSGFVFAQVN